MATANPASTESKSTTADDTLQRKSRDAGVVSGGHLVAKALKNEGVDTIFTLCGGHIIDIYDGCVDEGIRIIDVRHEQVAAHAADGYARQTGKLGCVVTTAGPGMHQRGDRYRDRIPLRKSGAAHRGTGCAFAAQNGFAAGPAARGHHGADHQVRRHGAEHREGRGHGLDGGARGIQRRARARVPRDPAGRAGPRGGSCQGGDSAAGKVPGIHPFDRGSGDIEKLADILVNAERPAILYGQQVWTARGQNEAIALLRGPRHSRLFQRREPRPSAARRSAPFRPDPLARPLPRPTCS